MRAFTIALLSCALAGPAYAQWTNQTAINTAVCDAVNDQMNPEAIPDGSGGAIFVWRDTRANNGDIYAQRLDALGIPLWGASGVAVCALTSNQEYPVLCADGAGGAIIAWADARNGNADVYAQRLDGAGVTQWTSNGVPVIVNTGNQDFPVIFADDAHGAFVVWRDNRNVNADLYGQRITPSGGQSWASAGLAIATAIGDQYGPLLATDGYGGFIVTWTDTRSGNNDVYAQRVGVGGGVAWTANGIGICTAADTQYPTGIISDGTYTTIIVWTDLRNYAVSNYDIYAQAVRLTGTTLWGANGLPVCVNTAQQREATVIPDGAGGAFVAWNETRSGTSNEIYGQHLTSGGGALWTANGMALISGGYYRNYPEGFSDDAGGFIVGWSDTRGGIAADDVVAQRFSGGGVQQWTSSGVALMTNPVPLNSFGLVSDGAGGAIGFASETRTGGAGVFAQRVDHYGYLGLTAPTITSVKDVPADEGGRVKLSFAAPYIEDEPWYAFSSYRIYRSVSPQALAARARPALLTRDPDAAVSEPGDALYVTSDATADYYWEFLSSVSVEYLGTYSVLAATAYDSTALGNPRTAFLVQARSGSKHWDSKPDSGYSADNLAPLAPAPFTGQYASGAAALHWNPNSEADLAGYRLYRGTTPGFTADPAHLVAALPDTGYVDAAGGPFYYKLGAVDVHGNESPLALLLPAGALGVDGGDAFALALARPVPNPARGKVSIAFTLPSAGRVTLSLHDVAGRRVALLADEMHEPGEYRVGVELSDGGGRPLGSGLYWVRLATPSGVRMQRLVVVH